MAPQRSAASIQVTPAAGARDVRPDTPVVVTASGGRLGDVSVRTAAGDEIDGRIDASGTRWTSTTGMLPFDSRIQVEADTVDAAGWGRVHVGEFRTLVPTALLTTSITPLGGSRVGVGMPIIVRLSDVPGERAEVEKRLKVTSSPSVDGAWAWVGKRELHWRPREYWPAGSDVAVTVDLDGQDLGEGTWGAESRTVRFSVGDARLHTVDIAAHTMTVTQNGAVLRTIPITTGVDDKWPTRNGLKVIMSKERSRIMDSDTVDIPEDSPDGYRLEVDYAMRLTGSGEFIHAAPWSVASQGKENVSHGCTGMSDENAAWLYSITRPGDVVRYVNGNRSLEPGNGWTDWNVSWDEWLTRSALA